MHNLKKIFTIFTLLFILLSEIQVGFLYADNKNKLDTEKEKSVAVLNKVETIIDKVVEKIDTKVKDEDIKERLEEKNQEVKEYLDEVQEQIEEENSRTDVKKIVAEAKKVVVLKVISGVTKQTDIAEEISNEVANTPKEKEEALDTITESLEDGRNYSLIISTKYDEAKTKALFKRFDDTVQLDFLYNESFKNFFEVFISKDSIFAGEMLDDITSGNIPESFLGIEIVTPEVFAINEVGTEYALSLQGEDLTKTWGVQKFEPANYLSKLKTRMSTEGLSPLKIGVVDTGIDYNHPDLKGRVSKGKDFVNKDDDAWDDQGHGTHVAGTIGASINGEGIIGVNPYVEFIPLKICNKRGFCPSYAVIKALDYAKQEKIDILNMSLGGKGTPHSHPICNGISAVVNAGGIVVAASGNSNIDTSRFVPGGCRDTITVAAVDSNLKRASFSNYGSKVDVSAPGVQVYSTLPNNRYRKLSGTSMATPHIVGLVSVMKSFNSALDTNKLKKVFTEKSIEASYESGKYIANFPDVATIVNDLTKVVPIKVVEPLPGIPSPSQETTVEEKVVEMEEVSDTQEEIQDDSVINSEVPEIVNQEAVKEESEADFDIPKLSSSNPENSYINFLATASGSGVEINSLNDGEVLDINAIELSTEIEKEKEIVETMGPVQFFDGSGKIENDEVEINSLDEQEESTRMGEYFEGDTLPSIPEEGAPKELVFSENDNQKSGSGVEINSLGEEQQYVGEPLYIDGAKPGLEINSVGGEEYKQIEMSAYSTGSIDEEDFDTGTGELIVGDVLIEELEEIDHTEEIIIDGAEKGVEINSVGGEEELQQLVFSEGADLEKQQNFVEIGGTGFVDVSQENFEEIDLQEEQIKEIKIDTEVFADGATKPEGVEINNVGDEEPNKDERLNIPDFSSGAVLNFTGSIQGEETEVFMTEEDMKFLESSIPQKNSGDEYIPELDEFDPTELEQALEAEKNSGVEINSFGDEEETIEVVLTAEEEKELEEQFGQKAEDEKIIPELGSFDAQEIIEQEEQIQEENQGVEINSFGEEEGVIIKLTAEEEAELEKLYGNKAEDEVIKVEAQEAQIEELDEVDTEVELGSIEGLGISNSGIEINNFGSESVPIEEKVESEEELQAVNFQDSAILEQAEEIYVDEEDLQKLKEYSQGSKYKELGENQIVELHDFLTDEEVAASGGLDSQEEGNIGIQNNYSCTIIEGGICSFRIYYSRSYDQYHSRRGIASTSANRRRFYVKGVQAGTTQIKMYYKQNRNYYHTINVTVKPFPKSFHKKITVGKNERVRVNLDGANMFSYSYSRRGYFGANMGTDYVDITGWDYGTQYLYMRYQGRHIGTIEVKVQPPVVHKTVQLGENYNHSLRRARGYYYSTSNSSLLTVSASKRYFSVQGKNPGTGDVVVKDRKGRIQFILRVTITPPPVITASTTVGKQYTHSLRRAYSYRYELSDRNLADINSSRRVYNLRAKRSGTLYVKVKDYRGNHKYTLKLIIKPTPVVSDSVYVGETYTKPLQRAHSYKYSLSNTLLANISSRKTAFYLKTKRSGVLYVTVKDRNGYPQYILKLTIKNPPKPKTYTINMQQGQRTNFYFPNKSGYKMYHGGGNGASVWVRNYNGYSRIYGHTYGNVKYKIYGKYHLYTLNINIIPKVQVINTEVFQGRSACHRTLSRSHNYSSRNAHNIQTWNYSKGVCFTGKRAGNTELYIKDRGHHVQTFKIKVRPIPVPKVYNITVAEEKTTRMHLPTNGSSWYRFGMTSNNGGSIYAYGRDNYVDIRAQNRGNVQLKVYDGRYGLHFYTIHIRVAPKPPIVIEKEVFETKSIWVSHGALSYNTLSQSNRGLSYSYNHHGVQIYGKEAGTTNIYVKDNRGRITYIYKITVKPKPQPKVYNITLVVTGRQDVHLPEDISKYNLSSTNNGVFYKGRLNYYKNKLSLDTYVIGKTRIHIKEKTGHRWDKYIINLNVVPEYKDITLHETECVDSWYHDSYSFNGVSRGGYAYMGSQRNYKGKREECLYGARVGKSEMYVYKDTRSAGRQLRKVWRINVLPKPQPKVLTCNAIIGDKCNFRIYNRGYRYSWTRHGMLEIENYSKRFRLRAKGSGQTKIYVRSATGNYDSHILVINVKPRPVKIYNCEKPLGVSCLSYKHERYDGYSFRVSKGGIASVYERKYRDGVYAHYEIRGIKEGSTHVYVYRYGEHIATVQTKVLPRAKAMNLGRSTYIQMKEGESLALNMKDGAGGYTAGTFDSNLIDFSVSKAGTIKITAKKAGRTYARIKDTWGAGLDLRVYVKDTRLVLGSYKKEITVGEEIQVEVYDYYKNVKSINKSNNNVSAYIKDYSKTQKSLMIRGKSGGETILWLEDYEGNKAKIELTVKGKTVSESVEKETSTGNVRYIRDWLNGSNRNGYAHWIELKAIEKGSGRNVALGKKVTGKNVSKSSYPYSKLVDNNTSTTYAESINVGENWIKVDLGGLYDISEVQVLHYYKDNRTYNGTKTEVSVDGKTWKVLFDSAVSGTYVEPKDGSGRSYDVKGVENGSSIVNELEKELENILSELEIASIEINSDTGCTIDTQKECLEDAYYQSHKTEIDERFNNIRPKLDIVLQKIFSHVSVDKLRKFSIKIKQVQKNSTGFRWKVFTYVGRKTDEEISRIETDLRNELIKGYADIGLDISGLKSTGEGLGGVVTYWTGYITDDEYLMAQVDLQSDLKAVSSELNPVKKFAKLKKLGEKVKNLKKAQNLAEKLALEEARKNTHKGIKVIDRTRMGDQSLGGNYDKYRYVHRSQDGTNITVHYHRHYQTGEVKDFKIKR